MADYGFGAGNKNLNAKNDNNLKNSLGFTISTGRVVSIILDGDDYLSIGNIEYVDVKSTPKDISTINPNANRSIAKPLLSNIKNYPLVNELVLILRLPDIGIKASTASKSVYYLNILSVWNHPHHNAIPFAEGNFQPTEFKTYSQAFLGSPKVPTNQPTKIFLGKTFFERKTVNPLLPFEGDVIYEGRWGNSIRFGSTVADNPNNWSSVGLNGDPILIIRNGQGVDVGNGSKYITEDINTDLGSVYITSTQKIPLTVSSTLYDSYKTAPIAPDQYIEKQIILNSGRLVFNSTTDHILLSSAQTIGFNSVQGFNFDTKANFVVNAPSIKLGSKDATEPLLLGNKTTDLLTKLVTNLKAWMTVASPLFASTPGGVVGLPTITSQLVSILSELETNLNQGTIKSKNNFTK